METVQGIVIKNQEFNDYDNIVTIFSKEFGKFAFVSLGTRKLLSKNKPSIQLFNEGTFEVFKSNLGNLSKLKKGTLEFDHQNLAKNYFNYLLSSVAIDLTNYFFIGNQAMPLFYDWLAQLLKLLNENEFPLQNLTFFLFQILKFKQATFSFHVCAECQKQVIQPRFFSEQKFGIICDECYVKVHQQKFLSIIKNEKLIQMLEDVWKQDFLDLKKYQTEVSLVIILLKNLLAFYQKHLKIWFLSLEKLKNSPVLN